MAPMDWGVMLDSLKFFLPLAGDELFITHTVLSILAP